MSYQDDDYTGRGVGFPPADDMTDEAQVRGLGLRAGDEHPSHNELSHPWGKAAKLDNNRKSLTFVQTNVARYPSPIAVQARWSLDGITYTQFVPLAWSGNPVRVTVQKSFGIKTGAATEFFDLAPGDALPFCSLIARGLTISVEISGDPTAPDLFVQLVAAPTTNIDCADVIPPTPSGSASAPITSTATTRFPAVAANTYNIDGTATPKMRYFSIVNQSSANLFVHLGDGVDVAPGEEFATVILPGDADAGYENVNYQGKITFKFDADDDAGYCLTTVGFIT